MQWSMWKGRVPQTTVCFQTPFLKNFGKKKKRQTKGTWKIALKVKNSQLRHWITSPRKPPQSLLTWQVIQAELIIFLLGHCSVKTRFNFKEFAQGAKNIVYSVCTCVSDVTDLTNFEMMERRNSREVTKFWKITYILVINEFLFQ